MWLLTEMCLLCSKLTAYSNGLDFQRREWFTVKTPFRISEVTLSTKISGKTYSTLMKNTNAYLFSMFKDPIYMVLGWNILKMKSSILKYYQEVFQGKYQWYTIKSHFNFYQKINKFIWTNLCWKIILLNMKNIVTIIGTSTNIVANRIILGTNSRRQCCLSNRSKPWKCSWIYNYMTTWRNF